MLSQSLNVDGEFLSGKPATRAIASAGIKRGTIGNVAAGKWHSTYYWAAFTVQGEW